MRGAKKVWKYIIKFQHIRRFHCSFFYSNIFRCCAICSSLSMYSYIEKYLHCYQVFPLNRTLNKIKEISFLNTASVYVDHFFYLNLLPPRRSTFILLRTEGV